MENKAVHSSSFKNRSLLTWSGHCTWPLRRPCKQVELFNLHLSTCQRGSLRSINIVHTRRMTDKRTCWRRTTIAWRKVSSQSVAALLLWHWASKWIEPPLSRWCTNSLKILSNCSRWIAIHWKDGWFNAGDHWNFFQGIEV